MAVNQTLKIETLNWPSNWQALADIRRRVFIEEQKVPVEDEWDEADNTAVHFLASSKEGPATLPLACARLLPTGQVGRMAVLADFRGQGVGSALLEHIAEYARRHQYPELFLDAQLHAINFYSRFGFKAEGPEFEDAGIIHRRMRRTLQFDKTDSGITRLEGPSDCLAALQVQMAQARRSLDLLSDHLNPALYSDSALVEAISALARRSRQSQIRILIKDTRPLRGRSHPLLRLAQRLPSRIKVRGLKEMPQNEATSYSISDQRGLIYFSQENELVGFYRANARAEARRQLEEFDHLWNNHSFMDPNLQKFFL